MKVKITEGTIIKGVGDARPGEIKDIEPAEAKKLFIAGKAVPYAEKAKKPMTRKPKKTTTKAKTKK